MRISMALACLTLSVLFLAEAVGLVPDRDRAVLEGRKSLCESVAIQCALATQRGDVRSVQTLIEGISVRNADILSIGLRRTDGPLVLATGAHPSSLQHRPASENCMQVPISLSNKPWGTLEFRFRAVSKSGFAAFLQSPIVRLAGFCAATGFLAYLWFLRKTLRHLDPSKVIPDRVRSTLDTLAEGLVVLDKDQRIALANQAFAETLGFKPEELQGRSVAEIGWRQPQTAEPATDFPWLRAMNEGTVQTGAVLALGAEETGRRTFVVNSAPIRGDDGSRRGALATFDDVTVIDQKNAELKQMLQTLKQSRDEIRRQNEELRLLATVDPLTCCLNRRSMYAELDQQWVAARDGHGRLCAVMVDIDHFKQVNDRHGHATGDVVLKEVARMLRTLAPPDGRACRYGGEEFCVVLPGLDLEQAAEQAEVFRREIEALRPAGLTCTASLGVSAFSLGAGDPQSLLEQADQALYAAKRTGRNRVVRWDQMPANWDAAVPKPSREAPPDGEPKNRIPFPAVTALISALAYRETSTAQHSRRVADLCVATAKGLMSESDCYLLEVAALLHDIGKLGVPDAILLKPGPLDADEWRIMRTHDRIGVEIIAAAFDCPELTRIVLNHHSWFAGSPHDPDLPRGEEIPLAARILTVADAYDAMVSDRVYRKGLGREEAFRELCRFSGRQFDPQIVERFINTVMANDAARGAPALAVPKQTALRIGQQIERLACALDAQDIGSLAAMAGRLKLTADEDGVPQIAELAGQLEKVAGDRDLLEIVRLTTDLLEMCRSTQKAYLSNLYRGEDGPVSE